MNDVSFFQHIKVSLLKTVGISLLMVFFVCLTGTSAFAVPQQIAYQGKLLDATKAPLDGYYRIRFSLYTSQVSGSPVWSEEYAGNNKVKVDKGYFAVSLGSLVVLDPVLFSNGLYLGVKVEDDPEMAPRVAMLAVPYAFEASRISGVDASQLLRTDQNNTLYGKSYFQSDIYVAPGKKLGLGVSAPQAILDVSGNAKITGQLSVLGTVSATRFVGDGSGLSNLPTRFTDLAGTLQIDKGGTGATSNVAARFNLGLGRISTKDVVILSGNDVAGILPLYKGGTGASTPSAAREALMAAKSGDNSDITSLSALSTPLTTQQGGTGVNATSAADLMERLGILSKSGGTMSGPLIVPQNGLKTSGSTSQFVLANNSVGIGTSAPLGTYPLYVVGNVGVSGNINTSGNIKAKSVTAAQFYGDGSGLTNVSVGSIAGVIPISQGGTGANTAAAARGNLGLSDMAVQSSRNVMIKGGLIDGTSIGTVSPATGSFSQLFASGQVMFNGLKSGVLTVNENGLVGTSNVSISQGGTGAKDAAGARANLGLGVIATKNTIILSGNDVSGALPVGKISGLGKLATQNVVSLATDVVGSLAVAKISGLGKLATRNVVNLTTDVTGALPITNGGTGATDAAQARINLGLNQVENTPLSSWQGSTNINTLGTILVGTWNATTIGLNKGGTGATTAAGARTNLGLGKLATQNTVSLATDVTGILPVGKISGLGKLATRNVVSLTTDVTGALPITNGGTGATDAAQARINLGLNQVENTPLSTWQGSTNINTVGTIIVGTWNATTIGVNRGGTGATTITGARASLGLGSIATKNTIILNGNDVSGALPVGKINGLGKLATQNNVSLVTDVTGSLAVNKVSGLGKLATQNIITLNSSDVTGILPVSNGGTGATNLMGYIRGNGANAFTAGTLIPTSDINGVFGVAKGGTGATTAVGARTNLGLGAIATKDVIVLSGNDITGQLPLSKINLQTLGAGGYVKASQLQGNLSVLSSIPTKDISGVIGIAAGGTGATDAAQARINLGLNQVENTPLSTWQGSGNINTVGTITVGTWNATTISVNKGGTGATTATGARANLGLGSISTKNAIVLSGNDVTGTLPVGKVAGLGKLATQNNVSLVNDVTGSLAVAKVAGLGKLATQNNVSLVNDVTGSLAVAKVAGLGKLATQNVVNLTTDVTGALPITNGGTGATDATQARVNLGLNQVENTPLSTWQGSGNINTVGTITVGTWNATTIGVTKGGTGATTAVGARTNLGLGSIATKNTIVLSGNDVSGQLPLAKIAGLSKLATRNVVDLTTDVTGSLPANKVVGLGKLATQNVVNLTTDVTGALPITNGGTGATTTANSRANLGLRVGTDVQAYSGLLKSFADVNMTAADTLIYSSAANSQALTSLSPKARSFLALTSTADMKTFLGNPSVLFQSGSNIGIGTTSPDSTFHIVSGQAQFRFDQDALNMYANASDHYPLIGWYTAGNRGAYLGWGHPGQYIELELEQGNNFIINGGKVGIGNFNPTTALDVNGTITATALNSSSIQSQSLAFGGYVKAAQVMGSLGVVSTIPTKDISGVMGIAAGGTGASDAASARSNLGLAIGTNVQAYNGSLASIAGLNAVADKMIYATAAEMYALTDLTPKARSFLALTTTANMKTFLGGSVNANTEITGILPITNGGTGATTTTNARANLGLRVGTDVQAYNGLLKSFADVNMTAADTIIYSAAANSQALTSLTPKARSFLALTSTANMKTFLGAGTVDATTGILGVVPITNGGTGTSTALTAGSVVFAGAGGVYSQNNSGLFWDNANGRLGIGTPTPSQRLEVNGKYTQTGAGGTAGDVNAGAAGFYSYNGPSKFIRFNSNGGAHDFLSAGAPLVINWSDGFGGYPVNVPQNVEFFGANATNTPTLFVNGNVSMGGGTFDNNGGASARTLTVMAGSSQSSSPILDVKSYDGSSHYVYVSGAGNVGIGTTSPDAERLRVAGSAKVTGSLNVSGNVVSSGGFTGSGINLTGLNASNISYGTLGVTTGGTGAVDAAGARSNLGLVIGTDVQAYNGLLQSFAAVNMTAADTIIYSAAANSQALTALTPKARSFLALTTTANMKAFLGASSVNANTDITGILPITNGGTGATTAVGARTNLGLGSIATKNTIVLSGNDVSGLLPLSKINGLSKLATRNVVDLSTDTTGTLAVSKGGTGTSTQFTPGSVLFAGTNGVYSQDNSMLFWDPTEKKLGIGTTPSYGYRLVVSAYGSGAIYFTGNDSWQTAFDVGNGSTGSQQQYSLLVGGSANYAVGSGSFAIYNSQASNFPFVIKGGQSRIGIFTTSPGSILSVSGNLSVGSPAYASATAPNNGAIIQGTVGIGTSTPGTAYGLRVAGATGVGGLLNVSGNITSAGTISGTFSGSGASVTNLNASNISSGTLGIANGGTGATTTTNARANLGLTIGTNVQAYSGLLQSFAAVNMTAADTIIYSSAANSQALTSLSPKARSFLALTSTANMKTFLGAGTVDASTGILGVVPVANGGTGTSTAFTTGSVVFAGASGVYSQNNSQLFWDTTNNRLGVGVTNPGAKLHVSGIDNESQIRLDDSNNNVTVRLSAGGGIYTPYMGTTTNHPFAFVVGNAHRLFIKTDGTIGVGTTTPASLLHLYKSSAAEKMRIEEGATTYGNVIHFKSANNADGYIGQDGIGMANNTQDAMVMATWTSQPLIFFTNQIERMRVGTSGTVGIGTSTAPSSYKLFVNGAAGITTSLNVSGNIKTAGTVTFSSLKSGILSVNGSGVVSTATVTIAQGGTGTNTAFTQGSVVFAGASGVYSQNNSGLFFDSSNKRLGVGTTNPSSTLHVSDAGTSWPLIAQFLAPNTTDGTLFKFGKDSSAKNSADFQFTYVGSGSNSNRIDFGFSNVGMLMSILAGGNVGVGNIAPASLFSVGSGSPFQVNSSGAIAAATGISSSGTIAFSGLSTNGYVKTSGGTGTLTVSATIPTSAISGAFGVSAGGTGATTTASARTVLGVAKSGANSDITSLSGLTTALTVAQGGTGTGTAMTQGSVHFAGASGAFSQDNSNFFWDNTNKRLGIGTSAPSSKLVVYDSASSVGVLKLLNGNNNAGDQWWIGFGHGSSGAAATSLDSNDRARIGVDIKAGGNGRLFFATGAAGSLGTRMYIDDVGYVGIGTTTPTQRLEVNGKYVQTGAAGSAGDINVGSAGIYSYYDSSRYIRFNTSGGANDLLSAGAVMVVNYSNGSGGTPQNVEFFGANNTSTPTLFVNGNVSMGGSAVWGNAASVRTLSVFAGSSQSTNPIMNIQNNGGTASYLYVSGAGNVGVGTTSPGTAYGLKVVGAAGVTGLLNVSGNIKTSGTVTFSNLKSGLLSVDGSGVVSTSTVGVAQGGTGTGTALTQGSVVFAGANGVYSQNNSGLFWDNTNGRLGVGTTTPTSKLTIAPGGTAGSHVMAIDLNLTTHGGINFNQTAASSQAYFNFQESGVYKYQIGKNTDSSFFMYNAIFSQDFLRAYPSGVLSLQPAGGNLGVGTTTPGSLLSVAGGTSVGSGYASTAAPSNGAIVQGVVGIGTSAPGSTYALRVAGATGVSGLLNVSGNIISAGTISGTHSGSGASLTNLNASNISSGTLGVANGGTGATTTANARTALGVAKSGANSDITSLSGLTTALSVAQGGTGATTASNARTNLGLVIGTDVQAYGGKVLVQGQVDGGTTKGIYLWDLANPDWGMYMSTSGSSKSLSGGTATTGVNGSNSHHARFRAYANDSNGFIFENSTESMLMGISGGNGNVYIKGNLGIGHTNPSSKLSVSGGASIGSSYAGTASPSDGVIIQGVVGIGTSAPGTAYALRVAGAAGVSGLLNVSGNITSAGTISGTHSGSGASLTNLNASNISSGTLGVANGGTGTGTAMTQGSIPFAGASGVYTQDNSNLFWDNTNKRLGIGTSTPEMTVSIKGSARIAGSGSAPYKNIVDSSFSALTLDGPVYSLHEGGWAINAINITPTFNASGYQAWATGINVNITNASSRADYGYTRMAGIRIQPGIYAANHTPNSVFGVHATAPTMGGVSNTAIWGTNISLGSSYELVTPPTNGAIIQGVVGIGTSAPGTTYALRVTGATGISGLLNVSGNITTAGSISGTFSGSGASLTNLNASNISSGTLGVANGGTGTGTAFTQGSVVFAGASGVYSQNNTGLFWDNSNTRLGIGLTNPSRTLQLYHATNAELQFTSGAKSWHFGGNNNDFTITETNVATVVTLKAGGNMGIGTTTPGSKLSVGGGVSIGSGTFANTAAPTNGLIVSGNVGIGTTSASNLLTIGAVNTSLAEAVRVNGGANQNYIGFYNNTTRQGYIGTNTSGAGTVLNAEASSLALQTSAAIPIFFKINGTERVRILPSGNVGIGTSTPLAPLHVRSVGITPALRISGGQENPNTGGNNSYYPRLRFDFLDGSSDIRQAQIEVPVDATFGLGARMDFTVRPDSGSDFTADGTLTNVMTLRGNGNVGIGITNATEKLVVSSGNILIKEPSNTVRNFAIQRSGTIMAQLDTTNGGFTLANPNTGEFYFNGISGTVIANIRNKGLSLGYGTTIPPLNGLIVSGNVGIGTTTPGTTLEVSQIGRGVDNYVRISNDYNRAKVLSFIDGTSLWHIIKNPSSDDLVFNDTVGEKIRFQASTGRVGIGTSTPGQKLSVAGTIESTTGGFKFPDGTTQTTASTAGAGYWTSNGANIYSNNAGSVGIGTSTPGYMLEVTSTSGGSQGPSIIAAINTSTTSGARTISGLTPNTVDDSGMAGNIQFGKVDSSRKSGFLIFYPSATAGLEKIGFNIHSVGDIFSLRGNGTSGIGIGATNPGSTVSSKGNLSVGSTYYSTAAPSDGAIVQGVVGIGTTTPTNAKLHVGGGANIAGRFDSTAEAYSVSTYSSYDSYVPRGTVISISAQGNSVAGGALIDFNAYNSSNGASNIFLGAVAGSTNGPANFVIGRRTGTQTWAESVRIDTNGNMGIGTTTPLSAYKLLVSGAAGITGLLNVSGNITTAGTISGTFSGSGANLTSLSASNISSGTLALARGGTGTGTAFTQGSVVFAGASGVYTQDNTGLFFDTTNDRLGIGTTTPGSTISVAGGASIGSGYAGTAAPSNGTIIQGVVGIGTSAPGTAYAVRVAGAAGISGLLNVSGNITSAGTISGSFSGSGANLTSLSASNITSGTLAVANGGTGSTTTANARTMLGVAKSGANTDITSVYVNNTGLKIKDTDASNGLTIVPGSNLTADQTLTLTTGDASRTITLNGDPTLADWFDQSVKTTASTTFYNTVVSNILRPNSISNIGNYNSAFASPGSSGWSFTRNIGDANPAFRVIQQHASSTGPILQLENSSGVVVVTTQQGNVGIGTTSPASTLSVGSTSQFQVNGAGAITAVSMVASGRVTANAYSVTGGTDVAEYFDTKDPNIKPGMVMSIDPEHPGHLVLASKAYDSLVAGIVSGANGINPGILLQKPGNDTNKSLPIALAGRVWVMVDATDNEVKPGDMLTTSSTPGHAMKVMDRNLAEGAYIGKAMTALKKGQKGFVLVLVTLK